MSLRTRLALAATAAVAAAVVLASVLVYFIVRNELYGQIDKELIAAVSQTHLPDRLPANPGTHKNEYIIAAGFGPRGFSPAPFRLVKSDGKYLHTDGSPIANIPVTAHTKSVAAGTAKQYYSDVHVDGVDARILTTAFGTGTAIQVATSIDSANHELATIRLWLILVALGGIGVASVSGFFVARSALRPVRDLSETAERVRNTRDLSQRIDITGSDELSHLAMTFNAMLESLDQAAQRQSQLVQDASHELRTPMTSLRTNIELLASNVDIPEEERRHMLSDIVEQLGEMTALVGEMTALARGEEQRQVFEEVRLDLIVEDAIRRTTRNHPDVQVEADLEPTTVVGVPANLERAFANLLDNAAKWSPPGGLVEVDLHRGQLTVRDHGPGIAAEDLPHVFERFYRATSARSMPGSGLGLAIVKQVADAHGGAVTAEQPIGGGTLMRLSLPSRPAAKDVEALA